MTDYSHSPQTGEEYKGISRDLNPKWPGWYYIDRGKQAIVKCPGMYGTREYSNWAAHLSKLLAELPSLQALVDEYERSRHADN